MSEQQAARPHDDPANGSAPPAGGTPPSDPDLVLGKPLEVSDDRPTVVSKLPPSGALATVAPGEVLGGSLRGRRLAHFELIEPIGVGGMAAVLRARDTQLDRVVALKILPPEMAAEPENIRRFHQEARAAARLDHENIARVFFCGEDQRLHFIAFEFVEGENLRAILERRGRLPVAEAIHYMVQIAAGLDHAASRGVVHRDIKPSNIIITPNGRAKLVDMGLARHLDAPGDKGLTQSGVTLGTFDYISPEQALEPRDADVRSDIYSLGCTFYHMLTGQPPVPEGTAAKKLHHHQHVPPLDPRVLNPDVPDSVAAILARMMAKEPRDRYQRPEHLVAHLLQVAQELGVAPEVHEGGVLLVDAPLPSPPQKRVGLLAAVAAVGLVAILAVLSLLPPDPEGVPPPAARAGPPAVDGGTEAPGGKSAPAPAAGPARRAVVRDAAGLRKALAAPAQGAVRLAGDMDLGAGGIKLRAAEDRPLTLQGDDEKGPAVLRVRAGGPGAGAGPPWASLAMEGGQVTFRNLTFVLDVAKTPERLVAAVAVTGARPARVLFDRCAFVQHAPVERFLAQDQDPHERSAKLVPAASVAVDGTGGAARPNVELRECYFVEGQTAVAVNGPAEVNPTDCAFGPHNALFHLRGRTRLSESLLALNYCSAFVVRGPAFRFDGDGRWTVSARYCIFSWPDGPADKGDKPALIRQTSQRVQVAFSDQHACYHGLNVFWAGKRGLGDLVTDWDDFRKLIGGSDGSSTWMPRGHESPWKAADPLGQIKDNADEPFAAAGAEAFQVNPLLPQLRQGPSDEAARRPLGVQKCVWGAVEDLPPLPEAPAVAAGPRERIVDPEAKGGDNTYENLAGAISLARSGDTVLIRHNGRLAVDGVHLKANQEVTVRPYKGFHPVLVLSTRETDSCLFPVLDGRLRLEQLELVLEPDARELKSQAVVRISGCGDCSFKDCTVTLGGLAGVPRQVVVVEGGEGKTMPAAEPRPAGPRVSFDGCFVRGEGDLVRLPQSRPVDLKVKGSALALDGAFLAVGGSTAEGPAVQGEAQVHLDHVTAYLTGNLVLLEDRRAGKGLAQTRVTARSCLFAAAAGRPLVQVEGLDGPEQLRRAFAWAGDHNWYSGFENVLDQSPAAFGTPLRMDVLTWAMKFSDGEEAGSHFTKLRFDLDPQREGALAQALPPQLRPRGAEAAEYGPDLEALAAQLGLPQAAGAAEESMFKERP